MHVSRIRSCVTPVGLAALLLLAACGDEGLTSDPANPFDNPGAGYDGAGYGSDTTEPEADIPLVGDPDGGKKPDGGGTVEPPDDIKTPEGVCTLEFSEATGDDGQACKGTSECNLTLFFSGSRSVKARYLCDGAPVASGLVQFDLIGDEANTTLEALPNAVYTDADGTAATTVNVANNNVGLFELRVSPGDGSDAQPISYNFSVESKIGPPLTVKFNPLYDKTQIKFDKLETTIYKHTETNKYECATIDPVEAIPPGGLGLPKATKVEESVIAPALPKLDVELHQTWTVVVLGKTNGTPGALRVVGCNDQDAKVEFAKSTIVTVDLNAVPPDYTGEYAVTAYLDLTSALPPNVKLIFDVIFGLFESPTGGLLMLVCKLDGSALDSICDLVFADSDNPKIGEWGSFGEIIVKTADAILIGLIEKSPIGKDVFHTGKDLGEILQHLELHSRIILTPLPPKKKAVPDSQGWFTQDQCSQTWDEITFTWTLNSGCNPNDPGCGQQNFNFNQFSSGALSATFEAQVTPSFYDMNVYDHAVNLQYGALLNEIIKQLLLPAVFGNGSDGFPKIDSYEEVIQTFLCGKEGMMPGQDCCQIFADNINVGAISGTLKTACKSLIPLGVSYLEGLLTGLDLDIPNMHLATAEPCKLYDVDADGRIDAWGKVDKPCIWALELEVFGFTAAFDAEFFAVRKN